MLNPDFYFYNPQNDLSQELIPRNIIETAKEGIRKGRQAQEAAESDWMKVSMKTVFLEKKRKPESM